MLRKIGLSCVARPRERLGSPRIPVDGVLGVLQQIGAGLVGESVRHGPRGIPAGRTAGTSPNERRAPATRHSGARSPFTITSQKRESSPYICQIAMPASSGCLRVSRFDLGLDRLAVLVPDLVDDALVVGVREHRLARALVAKQPSVDFPTPGVGVLPVHGRRGVAVPVEAVERDAHEDLLRRHLRLGEGEHLARPAERGLRPRLAPAAAVAVGHDLELVHGGADALEVGRLLRVPAAGLGVLGGHGDREQPVLVVERARRAPRRTPRSGRGPRAARAPSRGRGRRSPCRRRGRRASRRGWSGSPRLARIRAAMSPSKSPPGSRFTTVAKAWTPRSRVLRTRSRSSCSLTTVPPACERYQTKSTSSIASAAAAVSIESGSARFHAVTRQARPPPGSLSWPVKGGSSPAQAERTSAAVTRTASAEERQRRQAAAAVARVRGGGVGHGVMLPGGAAAGTSAPPPPPAPHAARAP